MPAELLWLDPDPLLLPIGILQAANLPQALRADLLPALERLVAGHHPEGLWLFGSWARGSASATRMWICWCWVWPIDACSTPTTRCSRHCSPAACLCTPLVASPALLRKHGDAPFWRSVKAEAITLPQGCMFP